MHRTFNTCGAGCRHPRDAPRTAFACHPAAACCPPRCCRGAQAVCCAGGAPEGAVGAGQGGAGSGGRRRGHAALRPACQEVRGGGGGLQRCGAVLLAPPECALLRVPVLALCVPAESTLYNTLYCRLVLPRCHEAPPQSPQLPPRSCQARPARSRFVLAPLPFPRSLIDARAEPEPAVLHTLVALRLDTGLCGQPHLVPPVLWGGGPPPPPGGDCLELLPCRHKCRHGPTLAAATGAAAAAAATAMWEPLLPPSPVLPLSARTSPLGPPPAHTPPPPPHPRPPPAPGSLGAAAPPPAARAPAQAQVRCLFLCCLCFLLTFGLFKESGRGGGGACTGSSSSEGGGGGGEARRPLPPKRPVSPRCCRVRPSGCCWVASQPSRACRPSRR